MNLDQYILDQLLAERAKRLARRNLIRDSILNNYTLEPGMATKRGRLFDSVAETMGVHNGSNFKAEVKAVLKEMGVRNIVINKIKLFRGLYCDNDLNSEKYHWNRATMRRLGLQDKSSSSK